MKRRPSLTELISLSGHKALVTGAGAGIGRAIAYRLAEAGANLVLVDLNAKRLEQVSQQLGEFAGRAELQVVDLASKAAIDKLWEVLSDEPPGILVNNDGIYPPRPFLAVDEASYQKVMATNLTAVFWMCQQMIRARQKRGGVIINIASIEAVVPFKTDLAHYSASKAGVIALTRALAHEYAKDGFRINALLPGGIITPGTTQIAKGVFKLHFELVKAGLDFRQRLPLGRLGDPDEVACMVLVLACGLSSYVQGAVIAVDGGFLSA